jgi:uncharacterized protein YggE
MQRIPNVLGIVLAAALSSGTLQAQSQSSPVAEQPVIVAQGEALLMMTPDRAYVTIAAEGRAQKSPDAQRLAAAAMTSVQASLKSLGLAADMIRTTSYTVQPQYDYANNRQTFREYLARNVIEVRVDDLARLADVIDAAGTSGATSVSSLRFDLKNRNTAELDALRRAVRDASARATAIAEGAGKSLGPVIRLQEQRSSSASPVFQGQAGGGGGRGGSGLTTPIEPGEIQVRATVTLTVAIR